MSLRSSSSSLLLLAVLATAACGKQSAAPGAAAPSKPGGAEDDARLLGRDLFDAMDAVLSYRSSHQRRVPQSLRQVGVDSLTRTTIRRLAIRGGVPEITSIFRSTEGHALSSCRGSSEIQEEASLNSGVFSVTCATVHGDPAGFKIQGTH
ncbi:MAG: hypothetical protein ABJC74_06725 [Gemmatimonadota bacterium]